MNNTATNSFSAQALHSADNFRNIMEAMARPGKIIRISEGPSGVGGLNTCAFLVATTLCDHETPVWLDDSLLNDDVINALKFQCSCPLTNDTSKAVFAFFSSCPDGYFIEQFSIGTPAYPDRSVTLIIQVESIHTDGELSLSGPGIKNTHRLAIDDVSNDFWKCWGKNNRHFPLGIDVLFVTDENLVALPRTTQVMEVA